MERENQMEILLEKYKSKEPEVVFEWHDSETTAKGWIVINSLKNGAAGGGTRMRKGLTKDEVVALAKVMEIKFSVCGPDIGGAKSGIDFDPNDERRTEVLERWFKAVIPILKYYYGTGGDLNVDEIRDVVPITEALGLWHPQEGVVNGHLRMDEGSKIKIIGQLRYGVSKIIEDSRYIPGTQKKYAVADMITGYGVAESVKHFYNIFHNSDLVGKRVIIQGWGNVASAAGFYLSKLGAIIVGIIDRNGGVMNNDGMTHEEVESLFLNKENNSLQCDLVDFETSNKNIWSIPCDIFIPGAASRLVTDTQVEQMMDNGLEVISCGANVPFFDDMIFFGETARKVDKKISLIPDFVANCGMARVFAYLMHKDVVMTDEGIFSDSSSIIHDFLNELYIENNDNKNISARSLKKSLVKISKF